MNCPICGGPYILGSDIHADCRKAQEAQEKWKQRVDAMLEWWEANKERLIKPD